MVILPLSPVACGLIATALLAITFLVGKWSGKKWMMNRIEDEIESWENDRKE